MRETGLNIGLLQEKLHLCMCRGRRGGGEVVIFENREVIFERRCFRGVPYCDIFEHINLFISFQYVSVYSLFTCLQGFK